MRILGGMPRKTDPLLAGPIILNPAQQNTCVKLRAKLRAGDVAVLKKALARQATAVASPLPGCKPSDPTLAKLLASSLQQALTRYESFDPVRQEWLRIAVDYFISGDDADNDHADLAGLDDDAMVVSSVLEHCGLRDLAKPIRDYLA